MAVTLLKGLSGILKVIASLQVEHQYKISGGSTLGTPANQLFQEAIAFRRALQLIGYIRF